MKSPSKFQIYEHESYDEIAKRSSGGRLTKQKLSLIVLGFIFSFFALHFVKTSITNRINRSKIQFDENSAVMINIDANSPDYSSLKALDYLPWENIIEPYRDQILTISTFQLDDIDITDDLFDKNSQYSVKWIIGEMEWDGVPVTININSVGKYENCSVIISNINSGVSYTSTFDLYVKYIRREFRTLTNEDRDTFISALRLLYDMNNTLGKQIYGEKYQSAEALHYYHLNGAGRTDCDHWHDGAGFALKHTAFTLLAEQSLQAINPAISMPYWEYASDAYLYDYWYDSPMFSEEWFGSATPDTIDHSLSDGPFQDVQLPSGEPYLSWDISKEKSLNPFVNAYGVMRSAWNNNPSSYIGRHNLSYGTATTSMPACDIMSACYESSSFSHMADCLSGVTHGPVHVLIGGNWGEGDLFTDHDVSFLQGIDKLLNFKNLWRSGFSRCPTSCSIGETCVCSVPDEYIDTYGAKEILEKSGVWDNIGDQLSDKDDTVILKVLRAIEDPAIVGEMFTSGASYDPTFWPVHGQIERILSLKRIRITRGDIEKKMFDEAWGWDTNNYRYLVGVCDWSNVSGNDDLTLPTCDMGTDYICEGHNADDELEFSNFLGTGDTYTNTEFYDFIHPWNEELPYIYDAYDFDYCSPYGYDFYD